MHKANTSGNAIENKELTITGDFNSLFSATKESSRFFFQKEQTGSLNNIIKWIKKVY